MQEELIQQLLAAQEVSENAAAAAAVQYAAAVPAEPRTPQPAAGVADTFDDGSFDDGVESSLLERHRQAAGDEEMARVLQRMEMGNAADDERDPEMEDPVWGKLVVEQVGGPRPHQVLCFAFCPCLVGPTLRWERRTMLGGLSVPVLLCDSGKSAVIRRLMKTWAVGFGAVQVAMLLQALTVGGGGLAPTSVNPMLGPWPSVLVIQGAKVASLIVYRHQYWRLMTPLLLHAGLIHLVVNLGIQLRIERGIVAYSEPAAITVGSSGALCGLMGAWLAEIVLRWGSAQQPGGGDMAQRMTSLVICSVNIAVTLGFSFVPYIDWAAHVGGLVGGLLVGSALFCVTARARRAAWGVLGAVVVGGMGQWQGQPRLHMVCLDE
ncbi:hypothetical protein JKP88DRAFT_318034 [Tribonema minus]|uniref:rhomboid protease n=1 Tax=Tribonema minus TaxID=303371 RepID=A0A835Z0C4_9STRA|nr:hypothetical protein JKP88DRAFT_318034 [Tribonema minus]